MKWFVRWVGTSIYLKFASMLICRYYKMVRGFTKLQGHVRRIAAKKELKQLKVRHPAAISLLSLLLDDKKHF